MKIHPVFNTVNLRPYTPDPISGRKPPPRPAPVVDSKDPEWEVETIKDSRIYRGKLQYLVKWKGYPHEESTWEPADNVKNSARLVKEFHAKHPSAPQRISATTFSRLPFKSYENFTERASTHNWTNGKHIGDNVP